MIDVPPYIARHIILSSYSEVDEVLRSHAFGQGLRVKADPFARDTLLLLDDEAHFERRRIESPLFSRDALKSYENNALRPVIRDSLQLLAGGRDAAGHVTTDVVRLVRSLLYRVSAAVTGIDGVDTPERGERFSWFIDRLGEGFNVEWSTSDHDDVVREMLRIRADFVEEFFQPSVDRRVRLIEQHHASGGTTPLPKDLITLLYNHRREDWDDTLPLREATLFLVASAGTSTNGTVNTVWHLLRWLEGHPEDRERLPDLTFIRAATWESLRLHTPSPALLRRALMDVTLKSGRHVKKDEQVALLFSAANQDPDAFGPNADGFNPHRQLSGIVKPWGLSFGGGEHACIGRSLAMGISNEDGAHGTMVEIVWAFFQAAPELLADHPAVRNGASYHDAFGLLPVRFTNI